MITLNARQKNAVAINHPFQCLGAGCENCYIEARYAARCHKVGAVDLRDGSQILWSVEAENQARAEDDALWEQISKEYKFECSCGGSYATVAQAIGCRKCRDYTEKGYCTTVWDRSSGEVVWEIVS